MILILLTLLALWILGPPAILLIVFGFIVWISVQARDSRAKVWAERKRRFQNHDLLKVLRGDARAVWNGITWRLRFRSEKGKFDEL